jgi:hypothetical protein
LCSLILTAAEESRKHINSKDNSPGEKWAISMRELESGKNVMETYSEGGFTPGPELPHGKRGFPFKNDTSVRPWLSGNWWTLEPKATTRSQLIGMGVRLGTGPEVEAAEGNTEDQVYYRGSHLRLRTDDGDAIGNIIPGRLRTVHKGSSIALARVKSWIRTCDAKHGCVVQDAVMPTRVLDLGRQGSQGIVLFEMHGQRGRYITLSHCWGASHSFTTTRRNLEIRKREISLNDLPKTFRDAVTGTRQLGVQYLWIDSLFIIQDDRLDWEAEASRMADVYTNSYLTISASSSRDTNSGCFVQ